MLTKKIAVLFSGSGSNLEAILQRLHGKIFNGARIEVALTLTNKSDAGGIEKARKFGLESVVIENKNFSSREEFDAALVSEIKKYDVDLVELAGFMRILTPVFTDQMRAIKESFDSDMQVGGVSVHWVSAELDGGRIIAQRAFEREEAMSEAAWEAKIHAIEHEILPQTIVKILCG